MTKAIRTPQPDAPGNVADPLTDILSTGARRLIEQGIEAELAALLVAMPARSPKNGIAGSCVTAGDDGVGRVPVKVPRAWDPGETANKIQFTPSMLPRYLREARSIEQPLPWLYLKGTLSGNFQETSAALPRPNAADLSSSTILQLTSEWWNDYEHWQRRDLSTQRINYIRFGRVFLAAHVREKTMHAGGDRR